MKVKADYLGITHYFATCNDCDWTYEKHINLREARNEIYKHVRETGHSVTVEKGTVTKYLPKNE